jgi:hypothetical protein
MLDAVSVVVVHELLCIPCDGFIAHGYDAMLLDVQSPCPTGRYGERALLESPLCSGICSNGYLCPEGSSSSRSGPCPSGSYCISGVQHKCGPGRFMLSSVTASSDAVDCQACPAGMCGG